ncbi:EpsG family protein [Pantoea sp. FN0307]|uniref:EpsG family protein n=1 Tax=Pantoea sp. FN0307 TaxID=3418560 RepID=UPI003CFA1AA6
MHLLNNFYFSIYGVSLFLVLVLALCAQEVKSNALSYYSLLVTWFVTSVLFGLRDVTTGTDTATYVNWFSFLKDYGDTRNFEWIFSKLGYIIVNYFSQPALFLYIIFLLTAIFLFLSFRKCFGIKLSALACVLFIVFMPGLDLFVNGIRNGLALAIASYGCVLYLKEKRKAYSLFLIAVSTGVHSSSIIFLVIYLMPFINRLAKPYLLLLIYMVVFLLEQVGLFNALFNVLAHYSGSHIINRILAFKYQQSDMFSGFIKYYFFILSLIPAYCFYRDKNKVIPEMAISLYYVVMTPYAFIFSAPSSYRFSYIGYFFFIVIICYYLSSKVQNKRMLWYAFFIGMLFITYSTNTVSKFEFNLIS